MASLAQGKKKMLHEVNGMVSVLRLEDLREQVAKKIDITALSDELWCMNFAYKTVVDMIDLAIERAEEDCCEWRVTDYYYVPTCDRQLPIADVLAKKFMYCPFCGKKIKLLEVE